MIEYQSRYVKTLNCLVVNLGVVNNGGEVGISQECFKKSAVVMGMSGYCFVCTCVVREYSGDPVVVNIKNNHSHEVSQL